MMGVTGRCVLASLVAGVLGASGCQRWPGLPVTADKKPVSKSEQGDRDIMRSMRSGQESSSDSSSSASKRSKSTQSFGLSDTSRDIERNLGVR